MDDKILFILDRAHGMNVPGKCSPDGSFKEWKYSDRVVNALKLGLDNLGIPCALTVNGELEPGLSNRVRKGNQLGKVITTPIFFSFHNNAGGGTGIELFTKPGVDKADHYAKIIGKRLLQDFPELTYRYGTSDVNDSKDDLTTNGKAWDKEKDFTVIAGSPQVKPEYYGVLIEFLFMDNPKDLEMLKDDRVFDRYIDSLLYGIFQICREEGFENFLIQSEK